MTEKQKTHLIELVERGFSDTEISNVMDIHYNKVVNNKARIYQTYKNKECANPNCTAKKIPSYMKKYCSEKCVREVELEQKKLNRIKRKTTKEQIMGKHNKKLRDCFRKIKENK